VDIYNAIGLKYVLPVGGESFDKLSKAISPDCDIDYEVLEKVN
jgi:hypothetical protein